MCLAIPMRLVSIDGTTGTVEHAGVRLQADLSCIETPAIGDYLIIHAGMAISRVDEEEAKETLDLFAQLRGMEHGGNA